jgi:hypothetical protein
MIEGLELAWTPEQTNEYRRLDDHAKKMRLLGAKWKAPLDRTQEHITDLLVKSALESMDDIRTGQYGLTALNGNHYSTPSEHTLQKAARWEELRQEEDRLRRQGDGHGEEDNDKEQE